MKNLNELTAINILERFITENKHITLKKLYKVTSYNLFTSGKEAAAKKLLTQNRKHINPKSDEVAGFSYSISKLKVINLINQDFNFLKSITDPSSNQVSSVLIANNLLKGMLKIEISLIIKKIKLPRHYFFSKAQIEAIISLLEKEKAFYQKLYAIPEIA